MTLLKRHCGLSGQTLDEGAAMAGYVFTVSKAGWDDFCEEDLKYGCFTPLVPGIDPDATDRQIRSGIKVWSAIFGDMVTMSPGDNVYFLSDRKIYGVVRDLSSFNGRNCTIDKDAVLLGKAEKASLIGKTFIGNNVSVIVDRDSYAAQYCDDEDINYSYSDEQ